MAQSPAQVLPGHTSAKTLTGTIHQSTEAMPCGLRVKANIIFTYHRKLCCTRSRPHRITHIFIYGFHQFTFLFFFFFKRLKCKVSAGPYIRHYQGTRLPSSQTRDLGCPRALHPVKTWPSFEQYSLCVDVSHAFCIVFLGSSQMHMCPQMSLWELSFVTKQSHVDGGDKKCSHMLSHRLHIWTCDPCVCLRLPGFLFFFCVLCKCTYVAVFSNLHPS